MSKPAEIKYGLTDRPPLFTLLLLSLQQVFVLASYFAIILVVYQTAHASESEIANAINVSMIVLAVAGLLQVISKGPIGSGYLAFPVSSAIYLSASILAIQTGGITALMTMTVFAGILEMVFGVFISYLRFLFTAAVTGLIILLVGFELAHLGLENILDLNNSYVQIKPTFSLLTSFITIFAMVALTIWGKGVWRLLPIIFGLVVGGIFAAIFGILPKSPLNVIESTSLFAVPTLPRLHFNFEQHLIFPFIFAAVAAGLRAMGSIITAQSLNDAEWTRPDFKNVKKGVIADGLGNIVAGFFGISGISLSPTSVAVSSISGSTSRYIVFCGAAILIFLSFFPIVSNLFLLVPMGVIGAALFYNGCFMMLGGIRLMTSRNIDSRAILVIGISFTLGTSRLIFPQYYQNLPEPLNLFCSSALSLTGLSAIILTLIFRLGIRSQIRMDKMQTSTVNIDTFKQELTKRLQAMNIPAAIAVNAVTAANKLVTELMSEEIDLTQLDFQIQYDQVTLKLIFNFNGKLIQFSGISSGSAKYMLEDQAAYSGLEKIFSEVIIDNISSSYKSGQSQIILSFFV